MTLPEFIVRAVARDATIPLRHTVLRPSAPIDDVHFATDHAVGTHHAGAFLDDELVSIGTISPEDRDTLAPGGAAATLADDLGAAWRLRGMATASWARSRGAGASVLAYCVRHAAEHGGRVLWCNARIAAVSFYERGGWVAVSDEFDLTDLGPHVVMERRIVD